MQDRLLNLSSIARDAMWMPVSSVDVERSFFQYKHLLNDRREVLTEENTPSVDVERSFFSIQASSE